MARIWTRSAALLTVLVLTVPDRPYQPVADSETDEATHGEEAQRWERLILQDEHGSVPADAYVRAAADRQRLADHSPLTVADAGVTRSSWSWLGPKNYSGRIRSIVVHPIRTTHLLAGAATGGIWKSTDAGATWRATNDFLPSMSIRTLVVRPGDPERVYAGTGEMLAGVGVLRSLDFGESWQHMTGSEVIGTVYRLTFAADGSALYAAAGSGLYRLSDAAAPTRLLNVAADDIDVAPTNPLHLLAAVRTSSQASVVRSLDGGQNWTPASGLPASGYNEPIEIAFAPSNPAIVYALTGEQRGRLYKSLDGGASFSLVFEGTTEVLNGYSYFLVTGQTFWNLALWVNPRDPNSIIAGGISLWKSSNGGTSWTRQSCGSCFEFNPETGRYTNRASGGPVDFHQVVSHPSFDNLSNRTVYVVFDQGIYRIPDIQQASVTVLNPGLGTVQYYAGFADQTTGRIIGGGQDTGNHVLLTGEGDGEVLTAGDGGPGAIDPRDAEVYFVSTQGLDIGRKVGFATYTDLMRCSDATYRLPDACERTSNFIAPFVMDLRVPDRLYAGGLRLWRTGNAREAVSPTSGPLWSNLALPGERSYNYISAIAVSPVDSNVVWAARNGGEIYVTVNATAAAPQWTRIDRPPLPARYPTRITIAPQDQRVVYVTYGGFTTGNVWRTRDAGATWENASGSGTGALPAAPVRDLEIYAARAAWIYAATEVGLFASEDAGQSWFVPQAGPAAVRIDDLFWRQQHLILATHGRGLWSANVADSPAGGSPGAPGNFSASVSGSTLVASWTAPSTGGSPQQYIIQAALESTFATILQSVPTGSTATTFSASGVPSGVFYLRVVAQNAYGTSPPSNTQTIGTAGTTAPGAPSNLVASVNGNVVTLTWNAPATGGVPTTYYIDAGSAANQSDVASVPTGSTATSFSATAPNGTYFLRVRAGNFIGASAASNEVKVTIGPPPCTAAPAAPTNLQSSVAGGVVTLTWTAPSGPVSGYRLDAALTAGGAAFVTLPTGSTTPTFSGGAPPGTYYVRVRAINTCGLSGASTEATVVVR